MGSGGGYLVEFSPGLEEEYTGYLEVVRFLSTKCFMDWVYFYLFQGFQGPIIMENIFSCLFVSFCILPEGAGGRGDGGRVADWQHKD